ncbi:MAG TPA: flagellar basal body-associated FliL family protein [Rhizobiaceae bacterium]|nr:flagellar basal body-associated FliL family protein [Rhizobiaceae bacterium]
MANVTEEAPKKSGPGLVVQIGVLLVMTLVAAGIGWVSGGMIEQPAPAAAEASTEAAGHSAPAGGHGEASGGHGEASAEGEHGEAAANVNPLILSLPPITTNLAAPSEIWVRMEVDVVLDKPTTDLHLAETVHQDLLAFMRTVKMHQIEGASGFRHLKADLDERAATRTEGLAKMVLIKTLLFE